ncbi:MAG: outer membrane beta-barrel protein [Saprospiraceae bacterium]|nr:outer membrane beta-barrel protein [Saprospiraceae bacterium]
MKNLVIVLCLLYSFLANAQEVPPVPPVPPTPPAAPPSPDENKGDTIKVNLGDRQIMIIENKSKASKKDDDEDEEDDDDEEDDKMAPKHHDSKSHKENSNPMKKKKRKGADVDFLNLDMGINILLNNKVNNQVLKDDLENKPFSSWSWTLNFLPTEIYLGSRNVMLMTSFGWRIGELTFRNKLEFVPDTAALVYSKNSNINKSSFDFHHLQVPLMLYFRSDKISGLGKVGFGIGGYVGALVHHEFEYKSNERRRKVEIEEDFGFETWRYGLSARADIGPFKIFTNYDLNPVWKNNDFTNLECGLWFDF